MEGRNAALILFSSCHVPSVRWKIRVSSASHWTRFGFFSLMTFSKPMFTGIGSIGRALPTSLYSPFSSFNSRTQTKALNEKPDISPQRTGKTPEDRQKKAVQSKCKGLVSAFGDRLMLLSDCTIAVHVAGVDAFDALTLDVDGVRGVGDVGG